MPGYDRTGPLGAGPMTGGARGPCNPATAGTIRASTGGRGFRGGFDPGMGRGRGFGRGHRWCPPALDPVYSAEAASEMDMLKADADDLQKSLDAINQRIDELSVKPSETP